MNVDFMEQVTRSPECLEAIRTLMGKLKGHQTHQGDSSLAGDERIESVVGAAMGVITTR